MNSKELGQQLSTTVDNAYKAIHAELERLFRAGKGEEDVNDAFGKVFIMELDQPKWKHFARWKKIRGVAMQGNLLFVYVQDTSGGANADNDKLSGADYLVPFDEARFLTPYLLLEVLNELEQI